MVLSHDSLHPEKQNWDIEGIDEYYCVSTYSFLAMSCRKIRVVKQVVCELSICFKWENYNSCDFILFVVQNVVENLWAVIF